MFQIYINNESFIFLFSSSSFSSAIKSSTLKLTEKELRKYVIKTYKCNKSKIPDQQTFLNMVKADCVHMHTNSFNEKEFNIMHYSHQ